MSTCDSSPKTKPELMGQRTCSQKVLDLIKTSDVSASGCGPLPSFCWGSREPSGGRAGVTGRVGPGQVGKAPTAQSGSQSLPKLDETVEESSFPGWRVAGWRCLCTWAGLFSPAQEGSVAFPFGVAFRVGPMTVLPLCLYPPLLNPVNFSQINRYMAYCRFSKKKKWHKTIHGTLK